MSAASNAELQMRVNTLEARVEQWDNQFGELVSCSSQARDAATRAANEAVKTQGAVRSLKMYFERKCEDRHGPLNDRIRNLERPLEKPHLDKTNDEWEISTGVMDRDQLVNSRADMKEEIEVLQKQLAQLQEAESHRAQAERDRDVAKRAKQRAEKEFAEKQKELAEKQREVDDNQKELRREKIKSTTSVVVTCITVVGGVIAAAVAAFH